MSGISVSGLSSLIDNNSYIRIILKDKYNYEYLVYENYRLLSDNLVTSFNGVALETVLLDDIKVDSLVIHIQNAVLKLNSLEYTTTVFNSYASTFSSLHSVQKSFIIDKLNKHLKERKLPWRAGLTPLSEKTYEEKKSKFGTQVPFLGGFEYYIGGIFIMPDYLPQRNRNSDSSYISKFDWRNRHGKNWMTPIKEQGNCNSCWAFATIGAVEAYSNLYFNRLINLDLSEQELLSCANPRYCNCAKGGDIMEAMKYIKMNGIIEESCFPYTAADQLCNNKCSYVNERIKIEKYQQFGNGTDLSSDSLKAKILRAPVCLEIREWWHDVILLGYKEVHEGDSIYINGELIIVNFEDYSASTAWLIKDSNSAENGNSGYCYVFMNLNNVWATTISGKVTSLLYSDEDIVCEDNDGDGYYFWGIGLKPASLPSWASDMADGDDSDPDVGFMNRYGYLQVLNPNLVSPAIITSAIRWDDDNYLHSHLLIAHGGELTISGNITMYKDAKITVQEGGTLIIDTGTVNQGDIIVESQGHLVIKNKGAILKGEGDALKVKLGATFDYQDGIIY